MLRLFGWLVRKKEQSRASTDLTRPVFLTRGLLRTLRTLAMTKSVRRQGTAFRTVLWRHTPQTLSRGASPAPPHRTCSRLWSLQRCTSPHDISTPNRCKLTKLKQGIKYSRIFVSFGTTAPVKEGKKRERVKRASRRVGGIELQRTMPHNGVMGEIPAQNDQATPAYTPTTGCVGAVS